MHGACNSGIRVLLTLAAGLLTSSEDATHIPAAKDSHADTIGVVTAPGEAVDLFHDFQGKDGQDSVAHPTAFLEKWLAAKHSEGQSAQVHNTPPSGTKTHFYLFCREELKDTSCDMDKVEHEVTDCLDCAKKFVSKNHDIIDRHNKCDSRKIAAFCAPAVHEFFHPSKPAIPQISETSKAQNMLKQWADQSAALCVTEMLHSTCDTPKVSEGLIPCLECADKHWKKVHSPRFTGETFCKHKQQLVNFCNEKELTSVEADGYTSPAGDARRARHSHHLVLIGAAGLAAALMVLSQAGGSTNPHTAAVSSASTDRKRRSLTDIAQVNYSTDQHELADRSARSERTRPTGPDEEPEVDRRPSCL
jgi:hypothetical protein